MEEILLEENISVAEPKLRFERFSGLWSLKRLGDVCEKIQDGNYGAEYPKSNEFLDDGVPFLTSKALGNDGIIKKDKIDFISLEKHSKLKKAQLNIDDVLFTNRGANVGVVGYTDKIIENGNIGPQLTLLRCNYDTIIPRFLFQIMQSPFLQDQVRSQDSGSAMNFFGIGATAKFKFFLPSLPEQQRIASFLSAVDEKIQLLKRKKELLEQYKKGVMQQLFSGKLRFKDEKGEGYPDWEEKKLGEVFQFYPTNSLSRDKLNYEGGKVRNIHYGDIHTKYTTLFILKEQDTPYINDDVDLSRINPDCYCQEGDLVIADASEDYDDIGKTIELIDLNGARVLAGLHTFLARPIPGKMFIGFSGFLVQADYVRKQIKTIAQGTKVLSISTGRLSNIKLRIPCLKEQGKIAGFVRELDKKIQLVEHQITHTQTFKKGLLQQMFV